MKPFKLFAFDIETQGGLGGEPNYVSYCTDHTPRGAGLRLTSRYTLTDFLLDSVLIQRHDGYFITAHNGLRFDFSRIDWPRILKHKFIGRVFTAKDINHVRGFDLKRGKHVWKFRDSFAFFPASLSEFSETFAPKTRKKKINFDKTVFNPSNPKHVTYAIRDSVALYNSCKRYDDFLREHFTVTIMDCVSLSGVAMKSIKLESKANGFEQMPALPTYFENIVRSSYHGGFTCAFKIGRFRNLAYYDINSAYAAVMKEYPMPGGQPVMVNSNLASGNKYGKSCISLCLATVYFNGSFPYLVSKPANITGRFSGVVTAWWWDFELALQKSLGATFKVHKRLVWHEQDKRLAHFVSKCERVRHIDYSGPVGTMAKLLQNSGYGKLGSAKHEEDIILSAACPADNAFPLLDARGGFIEGIWSIPSNPNRIKLTMVHWASYITARTRWLLMKYLLVAGLENVVLCDTDGFKVPYELHHKFKSYLGKEYGKLKLECRYPGAFDSIAPKAYTGIDDSGKQRIALKGIPKKKRAEALETGAATFEFTRSFMYVMKAKAQGKKGNLYADKMTRKISNAMNITCGKFVNGIWTPEEIENQDLKLIAGLTESDRFKIANYLGSINDVKKCA